MLKDTSELGNTLQHTNIIVVLRQ
uniref:Uncharacterized protein n=1 Tax=Rhizophora mucronata TaxID=61149 RepID=A0A2P2QK39_RHIMU